MSLDTTTLDYPQAVATAVRILRAGNALAIDGPPGGGKTSTKKPIAAALGLQNVFMIKMGHHEVCDIAGLPVANHETQRTLFYPSGDMLPPMDLQGGLLMVWDEAYDCNVPQQNLICQGVNEGRFHNYIFPPNTKHLLTGNRVKDRSGANRLITKLANRVAMITLMTTPENVFQYGARNGWNPTVLAFITQHGDEKINPSDKSPDAPTIFNSFDPTDPFQMIKPQFSSARSMEFVSDLMNSIEAHEPNIDPVSLTTAVAAYIGTPVATKFVAYRDEASVMPDPQEILKGNNPPFPTKQSVLWSLTLTLTNKVKKDTVQHAHAYLNRGPAEYLGLFSRILFDTRAHELSGPAFLKLIGDPKIKSMFSGV